MQYQSTRDKNLKASSAQAILNGLAPDGGLYTMPSFDEVKFDYTTVLNMDTMSMSTKILSKLLPDFSEAEMAKLVHDGYTGKFETDHLTPTVPVGEDFILELFRGPTSAFKDVALSMLPRLMTASKEKLGVDDEIMILTATSGDTGKAAMEGFHDVPGTRITVFYPYGGVSAVQQAQMATQEGANVRVCAVRGNFDDAQTGVKEIFAACKGKDLHGAMLSSANSINIGRLAPQVVYYFRAYGDLVKSGRIHLGDVVDYTVPTGNFGDILAGYYAKRMGLPVGKLVCASNENNVLTDFLTTGTYTAKREFFKTTSPSMDILVSSNLERLLYHVTGSDAEVAGLMKSLAETGSYTVRPETLAAIQENFSCGWSSEEEVAGEIRVRYEKDNYLCDTHTAVAFHVAAQKKREGVPMVVLSTASPFKFPRSVLEALGRTAPENDFEAMQQLEAVSAHTAPASLAALRQKPERFNTVIDPAQIAEVALGYQE